MKTMSKYDHDYHDYLFYLFLCAEATATLTMTRVVATSAQRIFSMADLQEQ